MQTLLHVSTMETGDELAVRAAHAAFPIDVLERGAGVDRLVVFIGSGYYALELTVAEGEVQDNLRRFWSQPEVQALFAALRPYVQSLPDPDAKTADLPLATAMLLWQAAGSADSTTV